MIAACIYLYVLGKEFNLPIQLTSSKALPTRKEEFLAAQQEQSFYDLDKPPCDFEWWDWSIPNI